MTKIERMRATLAGEPVDRPPFSVWYHFGNSTPRLSGRPGPTWSSSSSTTWTS